MEFILVSSSSNLLAIPVRTSCGSSRTGSHPAIRETSDTAVCHRAVPNACPTARGSADRLWAAHTPDISRPVGAFHLWSQVVVRGRPQADEPSIVDGRLFAIDLKLSAMKGQSRFLR